MAKAKRPISSAQLDPLAREILKRLFAEFIEQGRGTNDLRTGYDGPEIQLLIEQYRAGGSRTQVDFDLAMKQLEDGRLIKTGPMVPFDNKPGQGFLLPACIANENLRILLKTATELHKHSLRKPQGHRLGLLALQSTIISTGQ